MTDRQKPTGSGSSPWRVGFFIYFCFITTIVVLAYHGLLPALPTFAPRNIDALGHAILIGLLAFFLDGALDFRPLLRNRVPWLRLGPFIVLLVAGTEELLQALSPNRTCSWSDFVGDVVGIVFFSWVASRILRRREASIARQAAE